MSGGPEDRPVDLRALLHDAVDDVEPDDRLGDLRRRTAGGRRTRRSRVAPILAAGVATAAVVAGGVTVGLVGGGAERPEAGDRDRAAAEEGITSSTSERAAALYYLGDTPTGARLYREFGLVPADEGSAAVLTALRALTAGDGPDDPDYRTVWPADSFEDAVVQDDAIVVELGPAGLERPSDVSPGEASLGLQQVVYTAEGVIGRAVPVVFRHGGVTAERVLGLPAPGPVERDRLYATTAPVNISDPVEGLRADDVLEAGGTLATPVQAVSWRLEDASGGAVEEGAADILASGVDGTTEHVRGWRVRVDLDGLSPGTYAFVVEATSTGQTSDSPATFTDDRTIVVG